MGWRPYVTSWLNRLYPGVMKQELKDHLLKMFNDHMTEALAFKVGYEFFICFESTAVHDVINCLLDS